MARFEAWIDWALDARQVAWMLGALSAVAGLALALDPAWVHDEGLLTYGFARGFARAPLEFAFFQKCKPVLAAVYAIPASFGLAPFLVTHALVIALAVPLAAEAARALGARRPNVAALVIGLSPFLLRSGGTGLSNGDAIVLGLLAILLAARGQLFVAGLVAGASIWVRYETGILALTFFVAAIASPALRRMILGVAVFPALYLVAGALYHADPLWFAHWPPGPRSPVAAFGQLAPYAQHGPQTLVRALLSVSPALVALAIVPLRALGGIERALFVFVVSFVGAFGITHVAVLPIGPFFVLGFSERYAIAVLPAVALLAARAAEPMRPGEGGWRTALAACAGLVACGAVVRFLYDEPALLLAVVAPALALTFAASRARVLVPLPLIALALAGPLMAGPWLDRGGFRSARGELEGLVAMLDRDRSEPGGTLYTSSQLLRPYLARTGDPRASTITYVVQPGQASELEELAAPRHGQRETVRTVLPEAVFGRVIWLDEFTPERVGARDRVLVQDEHRDDTLPPAIWGPLLEPLGREQQNGGWTLYRLRGAVATPPLAP